MGLCDVSIYGKAVPDRVYAHGSILSEERT